MAPVPSLPYSSGRRKLDGSDGPGTFSPMQSGATFKDVPWPVGFVQSSPLAFNSRKGGKQMVISAGPTP